MLTTYQINKRVTDFSKMDDKELKTVYGLTRKQANSRLHYYLKGKPATKRIDHATPTAKKVVTTDNTSKLPIAREEVFSSQKLAKTSHVMMVVAGILLLTIVWINLAR